MAQVNVRDEIVRRLEAIAHDENRNMDEMVEDVLWQFAESHDQQEAEQAEDEQDTDVLLQIARTADELGQSSLEGNISERSRELLRTDFPEHLMRKMRGQL